MPGQFARLLMGQPKAEPALLISERAVGTDQNKKFVMVVNKDSKAEYREVALGVSIDGMRVVTSVSIPANGSSSRDYSAFGRCSCCAAGGCDGFRLRRPDSNRGGAALKHPDRALFRKRTGQYDSKPQQWISEVDHDRPRRDDCAL